MSHKAQYSKAFTAVLTMALIATGCTKKRDAALPDTEALQVFAISEFGKVNENTYQTTLKSSSKEKVLSASSNKATDERGLVAVDADSSNIPKRLKFMFSGLEVAGQTADDFKIVFGVDSKFVTAYKVVNNTSKLSKLEKQLSVSATEVVASIELQKATTQAARQNLSQQILSAEKIRITALNNKSDINVLVPIFKYEIQSKGILERSKNENREETSVLSLRETEFSQATHIKIAVTSDARKDVGSVEQRKEIEQIYTMDSLDNKKFSAKDFQERYKVSMAFVEPTAEVLTKLDSSDLKVYQSVKMSDLSADEQRLVKTNSAAGEIIKCSEVDNSADANCVLRLVAKVPVTYKSVRLNLADSKDNTTNSLDIQDVPKAQAQGLVQISKNVRAERARPTGIIDPMNTLKLADLQGEFYFRRTFEDASNMFLVGQTGTSGDLTVVKFEFNRDTIVVRNQKSLIQYFGQAPKDREILMAVPVKYFKLETVDASGAPKAVPTLVDAKREDAEYVEIDWTKNTVPVANSALAFYETGKCLIAQTTMTVADPDMRLSTDGVMNYSLSGSYTVNPNCANIANTNNAALSLSAQFNYDVSERVSFKKRTDSKVEDTQNAPNISPNAQTAMNFSAFTLADTVTADNVRPGRENSEVYHPMVHDFENGKVLKYWIGGLANAPAERRELIEEATKEVVAEWNEAFHKAFKGTKLDRKGNYIELQTESDENRGHLGDLDRNYLWYMDLPTENGLLGVAQPAPNPYSGKIVANNVIIYSGNTEKEVRNMLLAAKEQREYEKMLDAAKQEALAEFQKQAAEEAKNAQGTSTPNGSDAGAAPAQKIDQKTKMYGSYLKRLILSARPVSTERITRAKSVATAQKQNALVKSNRFNSKKVANKINITNNKDFTRKVLEQALASDFKNDPMMLEAIIATELARTETGMSQNAKDLLMQQARTKSMTAQLAKATAKRGGCFMYSREDYNDTFIATDFRSLFKKEIKATLLHEVGHALGLTHNFKASFDKKNFAFEGETTKRNYTSIMDYIASQEMEYAGPGTYDVHALRAIYTGLVELSPEAKKIAQKQNGVITNDAGVKVQTFDSSYINLDGVKTIVGVDNWSELNKLNVDKSGLLKHYHQCHDAQVGIVPSCARYDSGASATEIVKNEIQNYNRMYISSYHAADRLNYGWEQKVNIIRRVIQNFSDIRSSVDSFFQMYIYDSTRNEEEFQDYLNAAQLGYDFFHDVLRIPDTDLPYGKTKEEIKARLIPVPFTMKVSEKVNGKVQEKEVTDIKILEARRVYDYYATSGSDRIDTMGIGYDKQFALQFLMTANPAAATDNSHTGWIGYNEFEQYFMGIENATQSMNMLTLLDILSGNLKSGFVDQNHQLRTVNIPVTVNRGLLDTAALSSVVDTNQYRSMGLDSYAEFFKVSTLKGGRNVTDRPTANRISDSTDSSVGVKFAANDNALAANVLVSKAARKALLIKNMEPIATQLAAIITSEVAAGSKAAELKAKDAKLKDKTIAEIIAMNPELKALMTKSEQAVAELTKVLTALNKNGLLANAEEIKANPNMAIDKQVMMMRGLGVKTFSYYTEVAKLLEVTPLDKMEEAFQALATEKANNQELAVVDTLALTQEFIMSASQSMKVKLKDGRTISGSQIMSLMLPMQPLTSSHNELMYTIEDLARYTGALNPEYVQ